MLKFEDSETQTQTENTLSFDECCSPHYQELLNYARRLSSGDVQRAHDVVHNALVRALRAWHRFVPNPEAQSLDHAVRGWLYRIVCNSYMREYNAAKRRPENVGRAISQNSTSDELDRVRPPMADIPGPDPRDVADDSTGDEVLEAIARLTPLHRQVIEMNYLKEMTVPAIAAELRIPRNTVFTRLHRARLALKKLLKDYAEKTYGFIEDVPGSSRAGQDALEAPQVLQTERHSVNRIVTRDDDRQLLVA